MRVTFLLGRPDTAGGDRVIGRYATDLATRGHDVRLVSVSDPRSLAFYEGLPFRSLERPPFPRNRLDYVAAAYRLALTTADPGVVVATWTPTLPVAWFLAKVRRGRGVLWIQQDYPRMFEGLPWELWLLENGTRFASRTVAVSDACARYVASSGYDDIHVVHSGIEAPFFEVASTPGRGVLFVGDPIDRKGWVQFREAVRRIREHRPSLPVTVVARVPAPSEEDRRIPDVRWLRDLTDTELAREYAAADLFVCASLSEGWGLPALEAMAAGCPVVTTRHGGCDAYAVHRTNCLVVEPGDPTALADAMREALQDQGLREILVREGHRTAERYGWQQAFDTFESLAQAINE